MGKWFHQDKFCYFCQNADIGRNATVEEKRHGTRMQLDPVSGACQHRQMRIIALSTLRDFRCQHPAAEVPLRNWYADASRATWKSPADVKEAHRNASFVAGERVVFNIKGNDYCLIVAMRYRSRIIYVRFVGTHSEYDQVDAAKV